MISRDTIADMHIHSCATDGTKYPTEIVDELISKGVGIASLTDHNTISNQKEFISQAAKKGITAVSGVEISSKMNGMVYHILAYGFDPDNSRIAPYIAPILTTMRNFGNCLMAKMAKDYKEIDIEEYADYSYERTRGGWEYTSYLYDKGITKNLIDALGYKRKYNCSYADCDYPPTKEVIEEVLSWGAYPVLAHPKSYFKGENYSTKCIEDTFDLFKSYGLKGIECHYYSHDEFMTDTCLRWCRKNNMIITSGCDSHGDFIPEREIGKIRIPLSELNLKGILGDTNE